MNHLLAQHVLKLRLKSRGDSAFAIRDLVFSLKTGVFSYESREAGDSVFSFPLKLKTVLQFEHLGSITLLVNKMRKKFISNQVQLQFDLISIVY